ncbi:MAG: PTS sugar transporter subunit IIA [Henriciella sp.]|nr:PTS sugar transporter subunit IIA [Henriciella sp.]
MSSLLKDGVILISQSAQSRKQILDTMANAVGEKVGIDCRDILDAVIERENLGSTGIGEGVAIPHARIEGLSTPVGAFVRLHEGVDFDAIDGRDCDLIFMLLAPHSSGADHLRALAQVSRTFRSEDMRARLRSAASADDVKSILCPKSAQADAA